MDTVDIAQSQEFFARDEALFQAHVCPSLLPTGYCRNCGDPVDKPLRFCDLSCTQDYERRVKACCRAGIVDQDDPEVNERFEPEPRGAYGNSSEPGEYDAQAPRRNF